VKRLLVANRGEIALRVVRAARDLGIETVAVFSEADDGAAHVRLADSAVAIGKSPVGKSYLRADAIVEAAVEAGADAVHPGYGLLSERADFARACQSAGLTFVGPDPDTIDTMGDKVAARVAAEKAGVPTVPGSDTAVGDANEAARVAEWLGYPVMLKAAGGGR
jgi:acetyl-CoA carboxylase biotin carboxylase subunit